MKTKGIEHVTLTVPDVAAATRFFEQAFQAEILFDGQTPAYPPVQGPDAEAIFGMPRNGRMVWRRLLNLGGSNLELFQYDNTPHQSSPHSYDYGITHFAIYVDDLAQAVHDVEAAGGHAYPVYDPQTGRASRHYPHQGWAYIETPWGSLIELVTFPT